MMYSFILPLTLCLIKIKYDKIIHVALYECTKRPWPVERNESAACRVVSSRRHFKYIPWDDLVRKLWNNGIDQCISRGGSMISFVDKKNKYIPIMTSSKGWLHLMYILGRAGFHYKHIVLFYSGWRRANALTFLVWNLIVWPNKIFPRLQIISLSSQTKESLTEKYKHKRKHSDINISWITIRIQTGLKDEL